MYKRLFKRFSKEGNVLLVKYVFAKQALLFSEICSRLADGTMQETVKLN